MKKILTSIFALLALVSCEKESDPVDQATNGNLVVTLDLTDTPFTTSTALQVYCNGEIIDCSAAETSLTFDLFPDVYDLYIINATSDYQMEVIDDVLVATVAQDAQGDYLANPEALYCGKLTEIILESESQKSFTMTFDKMTSDVSISMTIALGSSTAISSLSSTLSGVAGSWDCKNNAPYGDPITLTTPVNAASLTGSVTILGTSGDDQTFYYEYNNNSALYGEESLSIQLEDVNSTKADVEASFDVNAPSLSTQGGTITGREEGDTITDSI